jgi:hypothetical protein
MCRDVLAERLAWFREMPSATRLERAEVQLTAERARSAALQAEVERMRKLGVELVERFQTVLDLCAKHADVAPGRERLREFQAALSQSPEKEARVNPSPPKTLKNEWCGIHGHVCEECTEGCPIETYVYVLSQSPTEKRPATR